VEEKHLESKDTDISSWSSMFVKYFC